MFQLKICRYFIENSKKIGVSDKVSCVFKELWYGVVAASAEFKLYKIYILSFIVYYNLNVYLFLPFPLIRWESGRRDLDGQKQALPCG